MVDGNVELQQCKFTLLQHYKFATLRRCGTIATSIAEALRRCCNSHYCGVIAVGVVEVLLQLASRQCWSSRQQRITTHCAMMASDAKARDATLLHNDGKQRPPKFLFFFYSTASRKKKVRKKERKESFKTYSKIPTLLFGIT